MGRINHNVNDVERMKRKIGEDSAGCHFADVSHDLGDWINNLVDGSLDPDVSSNGSGVSLLGQEWSFISSTLELHCRVK